MDFRTHLSVLIASRCTRTTHSYVAVVTNLASCEEAERGHEKSEWGNTVGEFFETRANESVNKALCKVNNMSINGIVKFYSNQDKFLKLSHKIGDFGEHNIYLIDEITES